MSSRAAQEVAKEALETIGKGKKPNISKIGVKKGYTPKTAASGHIQKTKSYQKEMKPLLDRLEAERDKIISRLENTRNKAKYRDLIDGLDKVTKNIQLLSGKETERTRVVFMPIELMEKHKLNGTNPIPKPDSE